MASQISSELQTVLETLAVEHGISVDEILRHLMQSDLDTAKTRARKPTAFTYTRYERITHGRAEKTLKARLIKDALSLWEKTVITPSSGSALPTFQRSVPR